MKFSYLKRLPTSQLVIGIASHGPSVGKLVEKYISMLRLQFGMFGYGFRKVVVSKVLKQNIKMLLMSETTKVLVWLQVGCSKRFY